MCPSSASGGSEIDSSLSGTITMRNTGGPKPIREQTKTTNTDTSRKINPQAFIVTRDGARIAYDHATRGKISMFVWALGTTEVTFDPPTFVQGQPGHTFDGFRMYNGTLARNYKPSKPAADGPRRLWKACPAFAGAG